MPIKPNRATSPGVDEETLQVEASSLAPQTEKKKRSMDAIRNGMGQLLALAAALAAVITVIVGATDSNFQNTTHIVHRLDWAWQTKYVGDTTYHFGAPLIDSDAAFAAGWFLFAAAFAQLIFTVGESLLLWGSCVTVSSRMNGWRWLVGSLVNPAIATILMFELWNTTTFELLLVFFLVHTCEIVGLVQEAANNPTYTKEVTEDENGEKRTMATLWPLVFSLWVSAVALVPAIISIAGNEDRSSIAAETLAAFALYLTGGIGTFIVQVLYYYKIQNPSMDVPLFSGADKKAHYQRYNGLLAGVTGLFRGLTIVMLAVSMLLPVNWVYANTVQCAATFPICNVRPIPNGMGSVTMTVPKVCSLVSDQVSMMGTSGFSSVDTTYNARTGYGMLPGAGGDNLVVKSSVECDPGFNMDLGSVFAVDVGGTLVAPSDFDPAICCDPDNHSPRTQQGCYALSFVTRTISRTGIDLASYHTGPALAQLSTMTLNTGTQDGVSFAELNAPDYNYHAIFLSDPPSYTLSNSPSNSPAPSAGPPPPPAVRRLNENETEAAGGHRKLAARRASPSPSPAGPPAKAHSHAYSYTTVRVLG